MTALNPPNGQSAQASRPGGQAPPPPAVVDSEWSYVSAVLIARRAYQIWDQDGRPETQSDQFWSRAEEELRHS